MYFRVKISRRTWAIRAGQVFLIGLGLVAATTAFRCPGPEPASTGVGGTGGGGGAGGATDSSSSTGMTCDADLMTSVEHCGACDHACSDMNALPGMTFCSEGQCVPLCGPPFFDLEHPQAPDKDDGCETRAKLVFVSQATVIPSMMNGLPGADGLCQMWAMSAGVPPGTFKAWLSDSSKPAEMRLTHHDGPYIRSDTQIVADDWADLTDGSLKVGIDWTENHTPLPATGANPVWTGTDQAGKAIGPNCNDWTGGSAMDGIIGNAGAIGPDWTILPNPNSCFNENVHLYCIEQ